MANIFNSVMSSKPKKSVFKMDHERKFSMNMGDLVPILVEDIVPGDSFKVSSELFIRLAPLVSPVMHRMNVFTHFFFVPNRIIWNDWEDFITGGPNGNLNPVFPRVQMESHQVERWATGSLADYLGYNQVALNNQPVSAMPFRAYCQIYNDYYRDQNLENEVVFSKYSGDHSTDIELFEMRKRAWEKDYFTSGLPWTQRGSEAVLPLGTISPNYKEHATAPSELISASPMATDAFGNIIATESDEQLAIHNLNDMDVEPTTINELRKSIRLQEWLEKNARGGARYIEQMLSHFGVKSSDARLQRAEYLGGGVQPVKISEVLQTSATNNNSTAVDASVQGNMAGHAISAGANHSWKKKFEEHGQIIGIMSIMPKSAYMQGLRKSLQKFDKLDFYWPSFAHLGEQPITNSEIYNDGEPEAENTFAYTPRYSEYKYIPSSVHGDFKDDELLHWTMARKFGNRPSLNNTFIKPEDEVTQQRIFADTSSINKVYVQIYHKINALRPMPKFGTPRL